jgi:hypothetical protein
MGEMEAARRGGVSSVIFSGANHSRGQLAESENDEFRRLAEGFCWRDKSLILS